MPYGHAAAAGVLHRGRASLVLAGGRAARGHAAGRLAPGARAREAARRPAARPLRPPGRAHRGGRAPIPRRAAPALARGRPAHRARRGGRGGAPGDVRDRRVDRARRRRPLRAALRLRRRPPPPAGRAERVRHAERGGARRRPHARARRRRRGAETPWRGLRAVLPRHGDARVPAGPPLRGAHGDARRAAGRDADRDAGRRRCPPADRGRAARACGCPPARSRCAARARTAGVGDERRPRRLRRHVHLAALDRERPRRRNADRGDRRRARARARGPARARRRPQRDARRPLVPRVRAQQAAVIVLLGIVRLPDVLERVGIDHPFVVAGERWRALEIPHVRWWSEIPSDRITVPAGADGIVAVGGGSAIDTAKAASAASDLPLVSVPTTYSGAEWSTFFGIRSPDRKIQGGGRGARLAGIVYDYELTL